MVTSRGYSSGTSVNTSTPGGPPQEGVGEINNLGRFCRFLLFFEAGWTVLLLIISCEVGGLEAGSMDV